MFGLFADHLIEVGEEGDREFLVERSHVAGILARVE